MIEERLEISREEISKIIMGDLGKLKICEICGLSVWLMKRSLSDCKLVKGVFHLWIMVIPCLAQLQRVMSPDASSMILTREQRAGQALRDKKTISKVKDELVFSHS
jgi:hypothetical protein